MPLDVQLFTATSGLAPHPSVQLDIPGDFKIIGGGALDHWSGVGNMLTASYPISIHSWFVAGKDHEVASPATITAFALAIHDPNDQWEVVIASETSDPANHPSAFAVVPSGFTLTGGGAFVQYTGAGNILTASFPNSNVSWEARSKDHDIADPAQITAYAIGLRSRTGVALQQNVWNATGVVAPHPISFARVDPGWTLSGGGAIDHWTGDGNLLTGSFPSGEFWIASGKDHLHPSPANITAYAIGILAP